MRRVAVITDSSAALPTGMARDLGIRVVPVILSIDGCSLRDGLDIAPNQVYRLLRNGGYPPSTSAPSVGDFLRVYAKAAQKASGIVSIHLSPELSATYNAALTASRLLDGVPIRILDCRTAAMGQGFAVIEAARAAARGADLGTVVARAKDVAAKVSLLATIGTLEYLHRGGRIGGAAALLGSVLRIQPVLSLVDGHVGVFAKPRTKSRAIRIMLQQMADRATGHRLHAAILHADVLEEAEKLQEQVAERFECVELTPVMGAHTGPGVLGIAFYAE